MNEEKAKELIDSLKKRRDVFPFESKPFLNYLRELLEFPNFCLTLNIKEQFLEETDRYFGISLTHLLRNHFEGNKKVRGSGRTLSSLISDREVLKVMDGAGTDFSLMARLNDCDYSNPKGHLYIRTTPLIIIPGNENNEIISRWEHKNTTYRSEKVGILGIPVVRRLTERQYSESV